MSGGILTFDLRTMQSVDEESWKDIEGVTEEEITLSELVEMVEQSEDESVDEFTVGRVMNIIPWGIEKESARRCSEWDEDAEEVLRGVSDLHRVIAKSVSGDIGADDWRDSDALNDLIEVLVMHSDEYSMESIQDYSEGVDGVVEQLVKHSDSYSIEDLE